MKTTKRNPLCVVGLVGILSLVFLFYVWGKLDLVRVGYQLDELSSKRAALQREHDRLQLDLSRLTAPNRIAWEAREKLNLLPPRPEQVVLVSGNSLGEPRNSIPGEDHFVTVAKSIPLRR